MNGDGGPTMNSSIITIALMALCGWLGWTAYEEAVKPVPSTATAPSTRSIAPAPTPKGGNPDQAGKTVAFPPLDTLDDMVSRPLFNVSRRPIVVETPTPEVKASELNVMLSGIVIGQTEQIAHLRSATDKETKALRVGDKIDGWQIQSIFPDRVVLRSGGRVETVYMQKPGESSPSAQATPPAQRKSGRLNRVPRRNVRRGNSGDGR